MSEAQKLTERLPGNLLKLPTTPLGDLAKLAKMLILGDLGRFCPDLIQNEWNFDLFWFILEPFVRSL